MRITILQPYVTTGAISKEYYNVQSFGLSDELAKRGHAVTILTTNMSHPKVRSGTSRLKRLEEDAGGFRVVYLPTLADPCGLPIFPTLAQEIARSRPDIVQAAEDAQLASLCAVLWCKAARVPVAIYQGMYSFTMSHARIRKLYSRTAGMPVYKFADAFICKSNAAREFVVSQGVRPEKAHVVPVGFKRDNYRRMPGAAPLQDYFDEPRSRVLLSVGRLVPEKGFDTAILAMRQVVDKYPDAGYVILGDGPERDRLSKLTSELNLQNHVKLVTEKIVNSDMNRIYSGAYAYLIPSRYEIFNMTMLEALACGCPVLACNVGGIADVIRHGETGYLFEPDDAETLAAHISGLLSSESKWSDISNMAQSDVCGYDWSQVANRFMEVYDSMAK